MNPSPSPTSTNGRNGKVSWTTLISTGSLVFALVGGGWALIKGEVDSARREMHDLKELTASERQAITRRLENDERDTAALRENKVDYARFNQARDNALRQFEALTARVHKLEQRSP